MKQINFLFLIISLITFSCSNNRSDNDRAVYYWKTSFSMSPSEIRFLSDLNVRKIYLRVFDVDWDNTLSAPIPLGEIKLNKLPDTSFSIIPVVYITNKAIANLPDQQVDGLADKILFRVNDLLTGNKMKYKELQIDCDWSESTRSKYFLLISDLKKRLITENKIISSTIRLHQIKYSYRTGIPPVDRGMLMFYNMGKINALDNLNSIYNATDAGKYTGAIKSYPLPLDVVLPMFGWVVHIRENKITGLLNEELIPELATDKRFKAWGKNSYSATESFFLHGNYYIKGDLLKIEESDSRLCRDAALKAAANLNNSRRTISVFDFDSLKITKYNEEDFTKIYNCFN
ncbi:MAG: hypothetical protein P4L27_14960 [Ignavibacteriaceae bacterium]|nr:hypothetical protein [Ignavibacteriaceae bacterium]